MCDKPDRTTDDSSCGGGGGGGGGSGTSGGEGGGGTSGVRGTNKRGSAEDSEETGHRLMESYDLVINLLTSYLEILSNGSGDANRELIVQGIIS